MHHWHWHRPSRLIWFAVGAVTATWFIRYKEGAENFHVRHCSRHRIPKDAYPVPTSQPSPPDTMDVWQQHRAQKDYPFGWPPVHKDPAPQSHSQSANQPTPTGPNGSEADTDGWEEERQRLMRIKQQATDSLLDFSEEGLESLMTSMEALRTRLAERRAQREQEAQEQAQREADFRQYQEWKQAQIEQAEKAKEPPKRLV